MIKNFLAITFLVILVSGCKRGTEPATISTDITNGMFRQMLISDPIGMQYDTILDVANGKASFDLTGGKILVVNGGRIQTYAYVEPGKNLQVSLSPDGELIFQGDLAAEQALLKEFEKQFSIATTKFSLPNIANVPPETFERRLEVKYEKLDQLLKRYANQGVASGLLDLLKVRIAADKAVNASYYPEYHAQIMSKEVELNEPLKKTIAGFQTDLENPYNFQDVLYASIGLISKKASANQSDENLPLPNAQIQEVENFTSNPKVSELLRFKIITDQITYGGGIDGLEEVIQQVINTSKDKTRVEILKSAVAEWSHLRKGENAPDFKAYTPDGKEVMLSDFKGKNVYIDVWATWCGPCIMEIPALKMMEEEYKEDAVEFVSVSIDQEKDKEKWKSMVKEKELGGTQLFVENAWSSDLTRTYNIQSIPRFLMIDKEGKIISANAPRPSNQGAFRQMMEKALN